MSAELFSLDNVSVQFGGLRALNGFSMTVERGSIHALIGPNGAGKSTVFNCISGFYKPASGDIRFQGESLLRLPRHARAKIGIGRTFQNIELCGQLTVLDNVLLGMSPRIPPYVPFLASAKRRLAEADAVRKAAALLERTGLSGYADVLAEELDFGHKKLLDVARALASDPKFLLLDEPAAGLRNREIASLDALLVDLSRSDGITILLVEHVMQLVMAVASKITVLNFGQKIAEGIPSEIQSNPAVIEAYLGASVDA